MLSRVRSISFHRYIWTHTCYNEAPQLCYVLAVNGFQKFGLSDFIRELWWRLERQVTKKKSVSKCWTYLQVLRDSTVVWIQLLAMWARAICVFPFYRLASSKFVCSVCRIDCKAVGTLSSQGARRWVAFSRIWKEIWNRMSTRHWFEGGEAAATIIVIQYIASVLSWGFFFHGWFWLTWKFHTQDKTRTLYSNNSQYNFA